MKFKIFTIVCLICMILSTFHVSGVKTECSLKTPYEQPSEFIEWSITLDSGKYDIGTCIQQTNDGGYICAGHAAYKVWLNKIDNTGNIQWSKFYEHDYPDYCWYVLQTDDDGYILLASTKVDDWEHAWLIKTDQNGTKLWERFHGTKRKSSGYCIQQTRDGGYIITGYTSHYNWASCYDTWLLKVDAQGYEEWNRTFARAYYNLAYSVKQTPDNGYIIVGGRVLLHDAESSIWLIKTDPNGTMEWDRTFGDEETWNMGRCVQLTSDGGFIIAGENLLVKTNAKGFEEWKKPIGGMCVQETDDWGYIITGYKTYSWKDIFKSTDLQLTKTDMQGNKKWSKIYGGEFRDAGNFIQLTEDGGYILIGYKEFPKNYPAQQRDIWVLKTGKTPKINNDITQPKSTPVDQPRYQNLFRQIMTPLLERFLNRFINFRF